VIEATATVKYAVRPTENSAEIYRNNNRYRHPRSPAAAFIQPSLLKALKIGNCFPKYELVTIATDCEQTHSDLVQRGKVAEETDQVQLRYRFRVLNLTGLQDRAANDRAANRTENRSA